MQEQLQEFASKWGKLNLSYARSKNLTPYDVLTIASMIEEEARRAGRAAKLVAAVIYNRLHPSMTLGIDATHPLRAAHPGHAVADASPSSTATRRRTTPACTPGLPPTPIATRASRRSQAAAHPGAGR